MHSKSHYKSVVFILGECSFLSAESLVTWSFE